MGSESVSQRSMSGTLPGATNTFEREKGARKANMGPSGPQAPVALRDAFPRYHGVCDGCSVVLDYGRGFSRTMRDTAAGGFTRCLCADCEQKLTKMSRPRRDRAERRAMVRHAARYSPDLARFVAEWFGVPVTDCYGNRLTDQAQEA